MNHRNHELLEVADDPYRLECFFPCDELVYITENNSIIPVPELLVYRKQALLLETICKKIAQISESLKYVVVMGSQDKSVGQDIMRSSNGDVISIQSNDAPSGIASMLTTVPTDPAVKSLNTWKPKRKR
jgi:hypothetical protein